MLGEYWPLLVKLSTRRVNTTLSSGTIMSCDGHNLEKSKPSRHIIANRLVSLKNWHKKPVIEAIKYAQG